MSQATIGRASAVAQAGGFHLSGLLAWMAWSFIHILYLIGFRNRALVFFQWVWSYIRYRRGARLITEPDWRLSPRPLAAVERPQPEPSTLDHVAMRSSSSSWASRSGRAALDPTGR